MCWPSGESASITISSSAESVTAAKRARIVAAARFYLAGRREVDCRFDVLLLDALDSGRVQWVRNAFGV